ncbi:MAG: class I SAM-dependent DNA methyltransferase, partial [Leucobacter sp.]|nr:class I SAM-dependent DNA methyltransferase [Leucobacter sp.]
MSKPLSLNEIRSRAAEFVVAWRESPGDERQDAQTFVSELLGVYGITERRAALYEKRAKRTSTGAGGYIDALVPGQLLIEMKSAGKPLWVAEQQALDYMDALSDNEQPRYVLTSDFKRFRLLDMKSPEGDDVTEWTLEELPRLASKLAFLAGYQTREFGSKEQEAASIKAAQLMAELWTALDGSGLSDHDAGVFLVRTLFALYADDSGVWERGLFEEFLETRTAKDGSDLGAQLVSLYQVMNQPLERRPASLDELVRRFPYVNGGVFEDPLPIPFFDRQVRARLMQASAFDWHEISPAIFGSLFQAVKSPEARRSLGEHYTTETNIMKTLGPLFLDELREWFDTARHDVTALKKLRAHLAEIRVLDPACGSGNFLIVAYRELRMLELDILVRLQELGDKTAVPTLYFERDDLAVQLSHIGGIEIEEWPAQIARMAIRLVDHQANMQMELALGKAPDTLPLDTVKIIHVGNALRTDWAEVMPATGRVRVVGNPPFIGQSLKSAEQTADLKYVWGKQYDGYLDYVTGWYKKSIDYFAGVNGGRFAFVSTNSIVQGQPVPALFRPIFEAAWRIRFAHQPFAWVSEASGAAAVHCVITGFDQETKTAPILYTYASPTDQPIAVTAGFINGYLIDGPSVFVEKRMRPISSLLPAINYGSKPVDGGHLIVEEEEYDA